jgi:hypothetical protein
VDAVNVNDTPSPHLHARLREAADAVRAAASIAVPKRSDVHIGWGVVEAVNAGPPATVDIVPGNNADGVSKWSTVAYEGWYSPTVGDNVFVIFDGTDRIVVGTMAGGGMSTLYPWPSFAIANPVVRIYPGGFVPVGLGGVVLLTKGWSETTSGSVDFDILVNGGAIPGLSGLTATTTPAPHSLTPYSFSDHDLVQMKINSISGTPSGVSFTGFSSFAG